MDTTDRRLAGVWRIATYSTLAGALVLAFIL
jgi:hypothetical protein